MSIGLPCPPCPVDDDEEDFIKQLGAASGKGPSYASFESTDEEKSELPASQWFRITIFAMSYAMMNTNFFMYLLPLEADRLNEGQGAYWLGVYAFVGGLTQLVCPVAGKFCDRYSSPYGRRRPVLVAATLFAMLCVALLGAASALAWPKLFVVMIFFSQLSLNAAYAAQCGLPADLMPHGHATSSVVSGVISMHSFVGSLLAVAVLIVTQGKPPQWQYPIYILGLGISLLIVCNSVKEASTDTPAYAHLPPLTYKDILNSFVLDWKTDRDFVWVCAGRCAYYTVSSVSSFLYFYVRDMLGEADPDALRFRIGSIVVVAQVVGAIMSLPASWASGKVGRKPVIYAACMAMCTTFVLWTVAPKVGAHGSWPLVLVASVFYGAGSGAYLSVDYVLALECLPSSKTTAEAFGLWGVAGFLGTATGPTIAGFILARCMVSQDIVVNGIHKIEQHYCYLGYATTMIGMGVGMNSLVVIATSYIRKTR